MACKVCHQSPILGRGLSDPGQVKVRVRVRVRVRVKGVMSQPQSLG